MRTNQIDLLNVLLIFISLFLAIKLPFELFLFSYAVLGPLHYLTEINWLKEKNYFIQQKTWIYALGVFAALATFSAVLRSPMLEPIRESILSTNGIGSLPYLSDFAILCAFLLAIGLVHLRTRQSLILFFGAAILASILILKYIPASAMVVGVFIPSVLHVYVFTLLFMIFGYLNAKSKFGLLAILSMLICPMILFFLPIRAEEYLISAQTQSTFLETGVTLINESIGKFSGQYEHRHFSFFSAGSIKIQIFIAFAYTYHYLNWFSKTSIIGWGDQISKPKLAVVIALWLLSVGLYYYNYKIGLIALFFLSILHIILEFPLNIASIKGIFKQLMRSNLHKLNK
jgi:hypothetical protein